jgi:DeoR/GlpR family transcriptional regulator of sugar metabolism
MDIRRVRADIYFMGVTGVHAQVGLSTGDAEEAAIKRTIAECSAEIVVLASSEKLGAASPFVVAPADILGTLIVPTAASRATLAPFRSLGVEIVRVPVDE